MRMIIHKFVLKQLLIDICILLKVTTQHKQTITFFWARAFKIRFLHPLWWFVYTTPFTLQRHYWVFFMLDIFIDIVNPDLATCRRTQPSISSRSRHLPFVKKKWGGVYFITMKLGNNTGRFKFFFNVSFKWNCYFNLHINDWFDINGSYDVSVNYGRYRLNAIIHHFFNHHYVYWIKKITRKKYK